jgi:hypothetical protein
LPNHHLHHRRLRLRLYNTIWLIPS